MPTPVRFKYGTYTEYKGISHDSGSLYFITDRGLIFRGDDLVTYNIDASSYIDSSGNQVLTITDRTGYPEPIQFHVYTTEAIQNILSTFVAAADAMVFKGVLGTSSGMLASLPVVGYKIGWCYKVGTAGTYAGKECEVGDLIVAINDGPITNPPAPVNTDWTIVQSNDYAVSVPQENYTLDDKHVIVGNGGRMVKKVTPHASKTDMFLGVDSSLNPTWKAISLNDLGGILTVPHGGTGVSALNDGSALIGNGTDPIETREIANSILNGYSESDALVNAHGIIEYVNSVSQSATVNWETII